MSLDRVIHLDDIRDIPVPANATTDEPAAVDHTWRPASIVQLAQNPPEPPTIGGLLYPGKRTVLSGETESMKTWFALILCKAELDLGIPVGWVDLDAMGPAALLERLKLLGLDEQTIDDGFHYFQPSEMLDPAKTGEIVELITARGIRLFIIDAFNPILSLHGLEPNSTPDIETFWRTIADPIANAGAAPTLLDHVVKNAENRGKYAYGSERKASGAIVHIGFKPLEALTKGGRGRSLLTVHKDRPGYLPRPTIGRLVLESNGDQITYTLEQDKSHDDTGGFRPTVLMEKASRYLEMQPDAVSTKTVEGGLGGKAEYVRKALNQLVEDAYATVEKGPHNASLYTSVRPYREADDTPTSSSSPPRPVLVPDLRSSLPRPSSLPLRGRGRGGDVVPDDQRPRPDGEPIREYDLPPIDESLIPYDLQMGDLHDRLATAQPDPDPAAGDSDGWLT